MKSYRTLAGRSLAPVTLAFTLIASAVTVSAQSLGPASDYNYFVFGNVSLQNTDAEGRVAIGGNASFTNYGVGDKLPSGTSGYSLVVDGNLTFQNGQVFQGGAIHGGTLASSGFNVPNGPVVKGDFIDFSAAEAQLNSFSDTLGGLSANGTSANLYGNLSFTGTDANLNTFAIQASDIDSANNFQIYAPAGSTVLINIGGKSVTWDNMSVGLNSVDKYHVLYNFYEAESVTLSGIGINGSILAPNADVVFNNGQMEGTLVSKTLTGTGEFHNALFQGNLPIPEPSSIILAAFSGTAILLVRRRPGCHHPAAIPLPEIMP